MTKATSKLEFKTNNSNKEYKIEAVCNSMVYTKELKSDHLPGLYYLL